VDGVQEPAGKTMLAMVLLKYGSHLHHQEHRKRNADQQREKLAAVIGEQLVDNRQPGHPGN